jgi:hypothetical protein
MLHVPVPTVRLYRAMTQYGKVAGRFPKSPLTAESPAIPFWLSSSYLVVILSAAKNPRICLLSRHDCLRKSCQAPHSVQKPSMSHHPNNIKNPPKWQMSYRPFVTLNVVELNREDPASEPGLSSLRSLPPTKVVIPDEVQNLRSCLANLAC